MVIRRRAVTSAGVAGLLALFAILLLRQLVSQPTESVLPFDLGTGVGLSASDGGAPETLPLSDQGRTVSMRERAEAIARAQVWREPQTSLSRVRFGASAGMPSSLECQFRFTDMGGTTPKFDCVLDSGTELRVKYGPGAEVPAEAAASRLLTALGFGADNVTLVERLHCVGCPNEPFVVAKVTEATGTQALYERVVNHDGRQEFEWVAVEQKFNARPIESEGQRGWAFFELDSVNPAKGGAPRAHVDALRLLAVFLAHWDNKAENQRLVCLAETWAEGTSCPEPFLLLQDVGSTFGPHRVDLDAWAQSKVWADRAACKLSMDEMPYGGSTFGPVRISERGRRFLGKQLEEFTDAQLTELFTWARFDQPRRVLMPTRSVADWVRVFKARVRQVTEGPPCPDA
jgi:hypothetical protein